MDIRIKPGQPLAYLRRAPMWLVLLASHDQHLDLDRQLIGMPVRSPRAVGQSVRRDCRVARRTFTSRLSQNRTWTSRFIRLPLFGRFHDIAANEQRARNLHSAAVQTILAPLWSGDATV